MKWWILSCLLQLHPRKDRFCLVVTLMMTKTMMHVYCELALYCCAVYKHSVLISLLLTICLWGKVVLFSFMEEETEAQRGSVTGLKAQLMTWIYALLRLPERPFNLTKGDVPIGHPCITTDGSCTPQTLTVSFLFRVSYGNTETELSGLKI